MRIVLDSAIIYNLKQRTFRRIASLPDAIQSPAVCVHENAVFVAGHKHIYKYVGTGINDRWLTVAYTKMTPTMLVPLKDCIYVAQNYFNGLFRFKPHVDTNLNQVAILEFPPIAFCVKGSNLLGFSLTRGVQDDDNNDSLTVEEYPIETGKGLGSCKIRWNLNKCGVHTTGCRLVLQDPPPINTGISEFHQEILKGNSLHEVMEFLNNRRKGF